MNILYCGDENIEDGLLISILSVLKNVKEELKFYVLTMNIENGQNKFNAISESSIDFLNEKVKEVNESNFVKRLDITDLFKREFPKIIKDILDGNNLILIYPEQEMWFNYKKPRPLKEGAYNFASQNNVPILSCFVEMKETYEKAYNKKLDYKFEIEDIAGWRNK